MTEVATRAEQPPSQLTGAMQETEALNRQQGADFLLAFYAALRSLKLYPVENKQVQQALHELQAAAVARLQSEDELEIRIASEFLFVNATRLRLEIRNYAAFSHVLTTLRQCGIGTVRVDPRVEQREWQVFLSLLLSHAARETGSDKLSELRKKMLLGRVEHIVVGPPQDSDDSLDDEEQAKEVAKRSFERAVSVTKDLVTGVRMGRAPSVKKVKRAVQNIVDQVLKNEVSITGLTTLRDYDDYTFVHSVNVCIFSVSIGRRLGLSKLQLYDLGLAALLHDVGKSRVPVVVLNKEGRLTEEEWQHMQAHPGLGVLTLFGLRGYGEIPYRAVNVAHEHHMKCDQTGYPKVIRPRTLSMFSKIVAVADMYDAATSRRVYRKGAIRPDQVLSELWEQKEFGADPVLVKALINLLGIYPVGTCVILDTYEIAIVHAANPDPSQLHRPVVRIVSAKDGSYLDQSYLVDLATTDSSGTFERSIVKVTDPTKYGITPSAYFV